MKEQALSFARRSTDPAIKLNLLREYLHTFILRSWSEQGAFQVVSFVGGTALRLLYGLPRFSEDIDFSLENPNGGYNPVVWQKKLKKELEFNGFKSVLIWNQKKTVHVGWVRIEELLWEADISPIKSQRVSIKIEVDTLPPSGAVMEKRILSEPFFWSVRHHDLPSLMAGKICAILTRPFTKGRDWFDLFWYLTKKPPIRPNMKLLRSALKQIEPDLVTLSDQWADAIKDKLDEVMWDDVERDVKALIERSEDWNLLTIDNLKMALNGIT